MDEITYRADGNAASFEGRGAVDVYAMAVIASGLRLYAKTGIKPNRAYTPTAMVRMARVHLGPELAKGIGARDYLGWADSLSAKVQAEKTRIAAEQLSREGGR